MGQVGATKRTAAGVSALTAIAALALFASALAGAAKVEPELLPGATNEGKDCADNVGAGQSWTQLKVDPNADGVYSDGTLQVTITNTQNDKTFDWSSNIGVDAVIVKGGSDGTYLYRYDPPSEQTSDEGLTTPGENAISHINFCYDVEPPGSLTVIKRVVNDDGGEAESDDWTMNVAGPSASSFAGAPDPGTTKTVDPGSYTVTESGGPSGYTLAYSGDCDANGNVSVGAGESKTCVLTNDENEQPPPEKGSITVEKQTIPDGYQPPQGGFDFMGAIEAVLNDGESKTVEVDAGTYTVTEDLTGRPFWDLIDITCDDEDSTGDLDTLTATYEVDPGEDVTCTFTNQKRSLLIIKKETIPAGAEQSFDFSASYDDGFSLADGEQNATPLPAGSYSVKENDVEGWELESKSCSNGDDPGDIDLPSDSVVTCTFVNRQLPETGTIIVEKVTNPSDDETEFDFAFGQTSFNLANGESETFADLEAGTYSVTEDTPDGWDLTSATCDDDSDPEEIELSSGETVTCTFTNTQRGTIVVEKQTTPDGAQEAFSFTGAAAGSIAHGQQIVVSNLVPGTYASTEAAEEGWLLTAIDCDDDESTGDVGTHTATFQVDPGETVTCVFRNSQRTVGRGSIDVQKSANPTTVKEPGGPVTFSVTIRNTSADVDVAITNVVDDKFGDLDDSGGNGCFDVPVNLAPGQSVNCTFQKTITGTGGSSHVNTVAASGTDEHGNPVSDSDDAKVDITPRLIDLVIVKEASSPTPLNGTVNYPLTVTNKGPDPATDVQLADPAPAGIEYQSATPSQGSCAAGPALVTCSLGTINPGQTVTIAIKAKATAVGTHVNTATVTGSGGRETNPADNTDSAQTVVPAPLRPPTVNPKPPVVEYCLALTVTPKMVKADGKPDRVTAKVSAGGKPAKGTKVLIKGVGIRKTGRTNAKGVVVIAINPRKPGLITITTLGARDSCGPKRIGVVGVFLPPLTG